jgi:hypothetical protein
MMSPRGSTARSHDSQNAEIQLRASHCARLQVHDDSGLSVCLRSSITNFEGGFV